MPGLPKAITANWPLSVLLPALLLTACQKDDAIPGMMSVSCESDITPIAAIQGDGQKTSMQDMKVAVRGVVTFVLEDGAFIESLSPDEHEATSEGLFLDSVALASTSVPGDVLVVQGFVSELGESRNTLTALADIKAASVCGQGMALPLSNRKLPMTDLRKESSEGMRLAFLQPLAVTDVYNLRHGQVYVSADQILPTPTEVEFPGDAARERAWKNRQKLLAVQMPPGSSEPVKRGAMSEAMQGVMGNNRGRHELQLEAALSTTSIPALPVPLPVLGDVRVVSLNLNNYFNGDGAGQEFIENRGARNAEEFQAQRQQLVAALREIQPHLVAAVELENDGFEANSAAADFLADLAEATGVEWRTMVPDTRTGRIGTDQIRVALFYRPDVLAEIGKAQVLESQPFKALNRPPLAQVFQHRDSGQSFLVAVNHLKSKGSCPDSGPNANNRDGTACWNRARSSGAQAMAEWARDLASVSAGGRALILGDINSYRLEEPIARIISAGFEDLTASSGLQHEYSYVYYGESGTLDYAFASPQLRPHVWKAQILKMNADYAPGMDLEHDWMRFSDHDPVIVDLRFNQESTSP